MPDDVTLRLRAVACSRSINKHPSFRGWAQGHALGLIPVCVTNKVLLEHMQAMKNDLQKQITEIKIDIKGIKGDLSSLSQKVDHGFEDAHLHRQALQEDLEATMEKQYQQGQQLARLSA